MVKIEPRNQKLRTICSICVGNGKGRFILTVLLFGLFLVFTICVVYQFRYIISQPHLNYRYLDLDVYVGRNSSKTTDDTDHISVIQKKMPNLPITFWNKNKNKEMGYNQSFARFPSIFDLEFNNLYWQTLRTSNGTFQLFGAYLDNRRKNALGPTVRILGMFDRREVNIETYCHLWFDDKISPVIIKSYGYKYIWYHEWGNTNQGTYQPYLISCVIPSNLRYKIPQSISLVEEQFSNATNNLRVIYDKPKQKKNFAVCVKGLDFPYEDLSIRLIEWIELLNLLGAEKIFFYELNVHSNISKVLKYYEENGKIDVTPLTLPGGQPNAPFLQHLYNHEKIGNKRLNELIPYNDCFYKHMYEYKVSNKKMLNVEHLLYETLSAGGYFLGFWIWRKSIKYIAVIDTDEVIMPLEGNTWKQLIDKVLAKASINNEKEKSSFPVRNVYFLDSFLHDHEWFPNIPKYMHMLQHVYRTENFSKPGYYQKCFYNTETVLTLHNHYTISCLNGPCADYPIDTQDAQLHHYRGDCLSSFKQTCNELKKHIIVDYTAWKFKKPLVSRVSKTLKRLGLLDDRGWVKYRIPTELTGS